MLEVAKVVGSFLKYSCCLMSFSSLLIEYSTTLAEVTWTGPHILWGSTVLVMFMLKSDVPVTVKDVVPFPDYFHTKPKICMHLKPEQYCTCCFNFVFIKESKHAILLQKGLSFMFILPLQ